MPTATATLVLDGAPTVGDYAVGVASLRDMLAALTTQMGQGASIEWVIDTLEASSAITTVRGVSADMAAVDRVATAYLGVGRQLRDRMPLSEPVASPARRLIGVITDRVPSIRFETADDDVTISAVEHTDERRGGVTEFPPTYGAVEGRVQTITNRGTLRFTLYDLVHDKAVSCYLAPGYEDVMTNTWGHVAVVEGVVKRDSRTGRPITVRRVTRVDEVNEGVVGQWRQARGVLAGLRDEPAEQTIRRLRDA